MSLETVVEDIRDEARETAAEIREDAEDRAAEIVAEAEEEAEAILEEGTREAEREIAQEREQRRSSATLRAKQARLEARRDVLEEVRSRVEESLASLSGERREELTRALIEDARAEFDRGPLRVYGRESDADLLEELLEEYGALEYGGEHDCLGGVVVESDHSRLRVDNTFDSVFDDVWEDNLREISDRLFEQ